MWCIGAMRKGLFRLKSKKKCCYNLEYRLLIFKRDWKNHNETGCLTEKNHFGVFSTFWCSIAWLSLRKMDSIHIHIENNFIFFFDSMLLCCCFCNFFLLCPFSRLLIFDRIVAKKCMHTTRFVVLVTELRNTVYLLRNVTSKRKSGKKQQQQQSSVI